MDLITAIKERHSVRAYLDQPIEKEKAEAIQTLVDECNCDGDLHIQLAMNEPNAFDCFMAHYGKFSGVRNYLALIGKKSADLQEKIGYYGEKIVLFAQTLGLNTCWVGASYQKIKTAFTVNQGEKLCCVIAFGYGATQGKPHKSKQIEEVSRSEITSTPEWFTSAVQSALLAPTALNQQKFHFTLTKNGEVRAAARTGFFVKTDLGIAKYHFELGASPNAVRWEK